LEKQLVLAISCKTYTISIVKTISIAYTLTLAISLKTHGFHLQHVEFRHPHEIGPKTPGLLEAQQLHRWCQFAIQWDRKSSVCIYIYAKDTF
jgi:hypothetical protein